MKKAIITTIAAAGTMLLIMGCGNLAKKDLSSTDSVSCVFLTTDTDINTYLITYKDGTIQTTYGFSSLEFDSLLYNCPEQISIDNRQLFDTIICIKDSLLQRTDIEQIHHLIAKTSEKRSEMEDIRGIKDGWVAFLHVNNSCYLFSLWESMETDNNLLAHYLRKCSPLPVVSHYYISFSIDSQLKNR